MKIVICTFAYAMADELKRMVSSANSSKHDLSFSIAVHSQKPSVTAACYEIRDKRGARLYEFGYNRGLARSLNDMMIDAFHSGADVVINANDDSVWGRDDVDSLADNALDCPDHYSISAVGIDEGVDEYRSMGYSVIALNPIALREIGCFDENCFPAYFEDSDYHMRSQRLGLKHGICWDTNIYHQRSLTVRKDPDANKAHDESFTLNHWYYTRKWGENYDYPTPFNAPELSNRIDPKDRRSPYGSRNRADLIVEPLPEGVR